jgi:hypothetical protein
MRVSSFTNAAAAARGCGQSRVTAASSAPMVRCRVRRSRRSDQAGIAIWFAADGLTALAVKNTSVESSADWVGSVRGNILAWGDSSGCHHCRAVRRSPGTNGHLGHRAGLDGNGLHSECAALRAHALPVHRAVLPGHDPARALSCNGFYLLGLLSMACPRRIHYFGWKNHLVCDRASLGKILITALPFAVRACAAMRNS